MTKGSPASGLLFFAALTFFLVSGATGLVYQVVWTRKLVLLFGATSYAVSTVLTVFFLGLAIGSLWGGRLADRTSRPLWWYAVLEAIIGLWAAVFIVLLPAAEAWIVAALSDVAGSRAGGVGIRAAMVGLMLIVPTTLMGATLPLLSRFVSEGAGERFRSRIGWLYTINTLGAVAGCAAAGFVLLPAFGYTRTTLLAALANVGLAIISWLLSRACETNMRQRAAEPAETIAALRASPTAYAVGAAFFLSGFCALALEVLWTRCLTIIFIGTTYAYTTMLAAMLCGIALGGGIGSWMIGRERVRSAAANGFGAVLALTGSACFAVMPLFAGIPDALYAPGSNATDWAEGSWLRFSFAFGAMLPATLLFGMTFPFAVAAAVSGGAALGRGVGLLYAANTFGGVMGAVAGGFLLLPALGTHNALLLLGGLLVSGGLLLLLGAPAMRPIWRGAHAIAPLLICAAAFTAMPRDLGLRLNQWFIPEHERMIHFEEGVEGTVLVSEPREDAAGSDRTLWINAVQATATIDKGVRMNRFQGVLPMMYDRDYERGLFMCFGSGITAGTLGQWPFERVDAVEISREVLNAAPKFAKDNFDVLENERIRFIVDDGRNFLLTTDETYDLITFEPMPLALAGVSTFYTAEYYELCREHLNPGGIVSQWAPLHSLGPDIVRSLVYTFIESFPHTNAWLINADLFLIGSNEPLRIDPGLVEQRLATPHIKRALAPFGLDDPVEFLSCFVMGQEALRAYAQGGQLMRDDRPWAEFEAPKVMFEPLVPAGLRSVRPHIEPPLTLMTFESDAERAAWTERLERRYASRNVGLDGQLEYREMGALGDPEAKFMQALDIDPRNGNARHYLKEISQQRARLLMRWGDFEKGIAQFTRLTEYLPNEPFVHLWLGRFEQARGNLETARQHYQTYVELGGAPDIVAEVLPREIPAGNAAGK